MARKEDLWAQGRRLDSKKGGETDKWKEEFIECRDSEYYLTIQAHAVQLKITEWFDFPNIARPFAEAFRKITKAVSPGTRIRMEGEVRRGFFLFLRTTKASAALQIGDLDNDLFARFVRWLSEEQNEKFLKVELKRSYLSILKRIVQALQQKGRLAKEILVPKPYWPPSPPSGGRLPLDQVTLVGLIKACHAEITATMERVERVWAEIDRRVDELSEIDGSDLDPASLPDFLIALRLRYGDELVNAQQIRAEYPELGDFIKFHGGFDAISEYRYPSERGLMPFVLMLAFYTAFNAETSRGIKLSLIQYVDILGSKRVAFLGEKDRAIGKQRRSFQEDQPSGPAEIVKFVTRWTARIRKLADPGYQDMLFLFAILRGQTNGLACNWVKLEGRKAPAHGWFNSLNVFRKEYGLSKFSLAQLRNTSLDQVRDLFGGDIKAVQSAGGQRSRQVIQNHYNSPSARARNDERLAQVMVARERWVGTRGKSADARGEARDADMGCVTPGFRCLDPYSSPVPGEIAGRLCQAYGWCPACPLANVRKDSAVSLARLVQLRKAFQDARGRVNPQRWISVWAPQLARLEGYWIKLFSQSEWTKAEKISLSNIPEIE